jgi:hypothetical protein
MPSQSKWISASIPAFVVMAYERSKMTQTFCGTQEIGTDLSMPFDEFIFDFGKLSWFVQYHFGNGKLTNIM